LSYVIQRKKLKEKNWAHEGPSIKKVKKMCEHIKAHVYKTNMFQGQVPFGYSWSLIIAGKEQRMNNV
jgi:hypothetical protein